MNQLFLAAFAILAPAGCHAALTVDFAGADAYATCQLKATVTWANVDLSGSYKLLKYVIGDANADCAQGQQIGGTLGESSSSATFERISGIMPPKCYFEGSTQYTFFVCDNKDQMEMPTTVTSIPFSRGNTTLSSCALHFEKKAENNYMAKLDLAATHEDGTVPAPGLPVTGTITLTSSAVTGTACDSLMLTANPMWMVPDKTKETTLSTTVDTEVKPECVTAWMNANDNTAVMKFNDGPVEDKFLASTDGSVGNDLGLSNGCAITWKGAMTTMRPKQTTSSGNSEASGASRHLPLWFAFFTLSLRVAVFK